MLAAVIPWGATAAGAPAVAALKALPKLMAARKPGLEHIKGFEDLVAGSWRRLVFGNPKLEPPLIDRPAYVFCVLEALHAAARGCTRRCGGGMCTRSARTSGATREPG